MGVHSIQKTTHNTKQKEPRPPLPPHSNVASWYPQHRPVNLCQRGFLKSYTNTRHWCGSLLLKVLSKTWIVYLKVIKYMNYLLWPTFSYITYNIKKMVTYIFVDFLLKFIYLYLLHPIFFTRDFQYREWFPWTYDWHCRFKIWRVWWQDHICKTFYVYFKHWNNIILYEMTYVCLTHNMPHTLMPISFPSSITSK